MQKATVVGRVTSQDGTGVNKALVSASLDRTDFDPDVGYIYPDKVIVYTDAEGNFTLRLWPNALGTQGSQYNVRVLSPQTGASILAVRAFVPDSPMAVLQEISELDPAPALSDLDILARSAQSSVARARAWATSLDEVDAGLRGALYYAEAAAEAAEAAQAARDAAEGIEERAADAARLEIGEISDSTFDEGPDATITGAPGEQKLNLTLASGPVGPEGPQGRRGETGSGINVLGELQSPGDLPAAGERADGWIIDDELWIWTDLNEWKNVGPIVGPQGEQGDFGFINIGSVSAADTGEPAEADIYGEPGEQFLDLVLPRGEQGEQGKRGPLGPTGQPGSQLVFTIKGVVDAVGDLPAEGETGDAWLVGEKIHVWAAGQWNETLDYTPDLDTQRDVNVVYVAISGDDDNHGLSLSKPVRTVEKALAIAQARPNTSLVSVYPGDYWEDGELVVPENCGVVSAGGQFVTNLYANRGREQTNMLLVNSGSYVQGFTFRRQQVDDFDDPTTGFAIAFAPGALIRRSPYIRDCSQISGFDQVNISAPLDPANGNPLVGKGGGVLLADRAVLNQNSIYPYMLAFGATPRTPNGLGYVAKNGAGINGISSISIFSRCAFYALNGAQITLNNSGTQFGDISMRAKGSMQVVQPADHQGLLFASEDAADKIDQSRDSIVKAMWESLVRNITEDAEGNPIDWMDGGPKRIIAPRSSVTPFASSAAAAAIEDNRTAIIDFMWDDLVANHADVCPDDVDWSDPQNEAFTRRDADWLLTALARDFSQGIDWTTRSFAEGLFDASGSPVFADRFRCAFKYCYEIIEQRLKEQYVASESHDLLEALIAIVRSAVDDHEALIDTRVIVPAQAAEAIPESVAAADAIEANKNAAIDVMWDKLLSDANQACGVYVDWQAGGVETFTRRDAQWLLTAIRRDFLHGNDNTVRAFAEGLFDREGGFVFPESMLCGFLFCYDVLSEEITPALTSNDAVAFNALLDVVRNTLTDPNYGISDRERFTRRDANDLITSIELDVRAGVDTTAKSFAQGLFDYKADYVFEDRFLPGFTYAWDVMEADILDVLDGEGAAIKDMVQGLFTVVRSTVTAPNLRTFGSLIESLGHQFNNAGAGVNKNALPINFRRPGQNLTVPFTIAEEDGGRVRWSGADELNNQYLAGGTRINGLTGRLEGRPFNAAVRQIARRIANTRGGF